MTHELRVQVVAAQEGIGVEAKKSRGHMPTAAERARRLSEA